MNARPMPRRPHARGVPRRRISETAVRPFVVVFVPPARDPPSCFPGIAQPARVEAFVAELTVEALRESVRHRLSRVNVAPTPESDPPSCFPDIAEPARVEAFVGSLPLKLSAKA